MFRKVILSAMYVSYRYECTKVGFIGLGAMGMELTKKLCEAGTNLVVHDINKNIMKKAATLGATCVNTPAEVASQCEIIFSLLPDYMTILKVIDSPDGIISKAKKGLLFVNLTTIGPVNAHRLEDGFKAVKNIDFLSAPVIGTNKLCSDSKVVFVVSGPKAHLDKVCKYLKIMAYRDDCVKYMGEQIGNAQSVAICNIFLSSTIMVAVAETINLADKLGLNLELLGEVLNSADAQSFIGQYYNPLPKVSCFAPANREYKDGHEFRVICRTLAIAQDVANRMKAPTIVLAASAQMYNLALTRGFVHQDYSAIIKLYEKTLLPE